MYTHRIYVSFQASIGAPPRFLLLKLPNLFLNFPPRLPLRPKPLLELAACGDVSSSSSSFSSPLVVSKRVLSAPLPLLSLELLLASTLSGRRWPRRLVGDVGCISILASSAPEARPAVGERNGRWWWLWLLWLLCGSEMLRLCVAELWSFRAFSIE